MKYGSTLKIHTRLWDTVPGLTTTECETLYHTVQRSISAELMTTEYETLCHTVQHSLSAELMITVREALYHTVQRSISAEIMTTECEPLCHIVQRSIWGAHIFSDDTGGHIHEYKPSC
jgi:hypothetical protein